MTPAMRRRRLDPPAPRSGFTLVELLVVITVLGILIGLLVPAITGAVRSAHNAQVSAEMTLLANALAAFKEQYGDYPPSRVILSESGQYPLGSSVLLNAVPATSWVGAGPQASAANDISIGQLAERSVRALQKMFPRAGGVNGPGGDFNGNASIQGTTAAPQYIYLEGHECLAFFLGGIPSSGQQGLIGFAKSPTAPFVGDNTDASLGLVGTSARRPPLFEFRNERLFDDDGDGIPGYVDSLGSLAGSTVGQPLNQTGDARFIVYFSSYGAGWYDPNDVNFIEDGTPGIGRIFGVTFTLPSGSNILYSVAPNPYTNGPAVTRQSATQTQRPTTYVNANTYQLISPGQDRLYGVGGNYDAASTSGRLEVIDPTDITATDVGGVRIRESDNITNFANGKLE